MSKNIWNPMSKKTMVDASMDLNNSIFNDWFFRLIELEINMYEWKDIPETIDERFLEMALLYDGMAVFFEDEVMGYLALQVMIGGDLNVYRVPNIRNAYAVNGYNRTLGPDNSVIIFNNRLRTPSVKTLQLYALKLAELDMTILTNVKAQKTPTLITCSESQKLSMKNLYMKYDGNQPLIFAEKGMDPNSISCLKTDAPYVAQDLQLLKRQIWHEALTYIGIVNSNTEKRERLVGSEVETSIAAVETQRYTKLNARRYAAKQINKMFGLNISVDFREGDDTGVKLYNDTEIVGGNAELSPERVPAD